MADLNETADATGNGGDGNGGGDGKSRGFPPPSVVSEEPARRGDLVGERYFVLGELGRGGMGIVYEAADKSLARTVALKFVRSDKTGSGDDQLFKEGQRMAKLEPHSNVVVVYDCQRYLGQICLVLQFIDGKKTLRQWEDEEPRHWRDVLTMYREAGEGLLHAHNSGQVHRDFKAANVLLDKQGEPHVSDFGLSRDADAPVRALDASKHPAAGTPGYMSPEQLGGHQKLTPASDQFSFCAALYRALYGELPFGDKPALPLPAVRPAPTGKRVPGWVRQVVLKGLRVDPATRYPDMRGLLDALANDPGPRRRALAVRGSGAVLLLSLVAGVAWVQHAATSQRRECEARATTAFEQIFGSARKQQIAEAFTRANPGNGRADFERVRARVEPEASRWRDLSIAACSMRDQQAKERTQSCLEERRKTLKTISTLFSDADERIEENALSTVLTEVLPSNTCQQGTTHADTTSTPQNSADDPLDDDLARARVLLVAGKYNEAIEETFNVNDGAAHENRTTVAAEATLLLGEVRTETHRLDADIYLKQAIRLADQLGNDLLRTRAHLIYAKWWADRGEGRADSRFIEANEELRQAEAILQRMGGNPLLAAQVIMLKGRLAALNHQPAVAEQHYRAAFGLLRQLLSPEHPLIAKVKSNIALQLNRDDAVPMLKEVKTSLEALYGSHHPEIASVWHNIGRKCLDAEDWVCAIDAFREAKRLRDPTRSYDPERLGHTESNLATALDKSGSLEEALENRDLAINDLIEAQADPEEIIVELKLKLELLKKLGRSKTEQDAVEKDIKTRSGSAAKP